jgi:GNAT superfamily N-acetyltransferase
MALLSHFPVSRVVTELCNARLEELWFQTELCLRSKAVWRYDDTFMEACRDELSLTPDDLASTHVQVAVNEDIPLGIARINLDGREANLLKPFVEPKRLGGGIGKQLLSWATAKAASLGARRFIIEADPDAVPFYHRNGAKLEGSAPSRSIPGRLLPRLAIDLTAVSSVEIGKLYGPYGQWCDQEGLRALSTDEFACEFAGVETPQAAGSAIALELALVA